MGKFDLDFTLVQGALYTDPNKIPVKGNEHRMVRVAFDLFHLKGDEQEDLWQVQADDDGEFLVRTYSLPEEEGQLTASDWSVKEDSKQANLTIAYRGIPIQRIATKDFGANTPEDVTTLRGVILQKLAKDKEFTFRFFEDLSDSKKDILKMAGFRKELKNWLTSQDVTDDIMAKIIAVVEEEEPPFLQNCPRKEKEKEEDQKAEDYREFFKEKAKEYGALSGDPQEIPKEKRYDFFNEVDREWQAENEGIESNDMSLAALELELQLKRTAEPSTAQPPPLPPDLRFDTSDVESETGEWAPRKVEPADSFLIDEEKVDDIVKKIEQLSPQTQEALKLRLK